jgi:endonuclease/exonuclease/phosphatase family metal-dependent hydrolase
MEMRFMSFNIRFDNPHDGDHAWPNRKEFLSGIIKDFRAEVLGTQEGRQPQLLELAELLPTLSLIDIHREWIDERMYPTLFYNPKIFSLIESGDIWLSKTPETPGSSSFDSAFPRLCTWAKLKRHSGEIIFFVNAHLDHVKESTRLSQAKVLTTEVTELAGDLPIIIMGDFNSAPNSMVRNQIMRELRGINDPWETLKLPEEVSYHKFGPTPDDGQRIDWFLVSQDFKPKYLELDKVSRDNLWPSDHYPLKLIIALGNDE